MTSQATPAPKTSSPQVRINSFSTYIQELSYHPDMLGNRKNKSVLPKNEATEIAKTAGQDAADTVKKAPSLKITIKLDLNVHVTLNAYLDGWVEIGLLCWGLVVCWLPSAESIHMK